MQLSIKRGFWEIRKVYGGTLDTLSQTPVICSDCCWDPEGLYIPLIKGARKVVVGARARAEGGLRKVS